MPDYILIVAFLVTLLLLTAPVWMYIIVYQPRLFYAGYLLLVTKMFGFLPMILGSRVKAIIFFVHCGMILAVVALLLMGRKFSSRTVVLFLTCVFSLIAFGVLYPYFLGFSSISSAIVDGKDMFGYAALAYLAIHSRRFDFDYFLRLFCFVGVVFTVVIIVGHITGYCPPSYYHVWETHIVKVHHNTYISLAVCLVASRMLKPRINFPCTFLFLFLLAGLLLQGHRSIVLATLLAVSLLWLVRAHSAIKFVSVLAILPFLFGIFFLDNGRYFEAYVLEPISEVKNKETGAIVARSRVNAFRFGYMEQRPLLGYGFIDETSSLGRTIAEQSDNRFKQTMGIVDSGYVDMRIRFGIVGMLAFCFVLGFLLLERFVHARHLGDEQVAMALFLSTFFLVNYTWSVFTYGFGIMCVCVAIYLMYRDYPTGNAASRNSKG